MKRLYLIFSILISSTTLMGQQPVPEKPYILISADIGGTSDANLFEGKWQGSRTVSKWRKEVLQDWAKRWELLKQIIS